MNYDNTIIIYPIWTPDDLKSFDCVFNEEYMYVHLSKHIYNSFDKYGEILNFLINIDHKRTGCMYIYYIIEYRDYDVVKNMIEKKQLVDYVVKFLTFNIKVDVLTVETYNLNDIEEDYTVLYWGDGEF